MLVANRLLVLCKIISVSFLMSIVYLLTGSNMGNRLRRLNRAAALVNNQIGTVRRVSAVYETAPWGNTEQPAFLNQVLEVYTVLEPKAALNLIMLIESQMGRVRTEKWGQRCIDIDILLFDSLVINSPALTIPHLLLPMRRFALTPLAELAPHFLHPILQVSIQELLQNCPDELPVTYYKATKQGRHIGKG